MFIILNKAVVNYCLDMLFLDYGFNPVLVVIVASHIRLIVMVTVLHRDAKLTRTKPFVHIQNIFCTRTKLSDNDN